MKESLISISGTIEHLEVGVKRTDLVNFGKGTEIQNGVAAVQAAAGNLGLVAAASSVAMYDGEDMDYFAFYIGDDLIQGVFPHVTFEIGDYVTVIVQRLNGENNAVAVRCIDKNSLWLPLMIDCGPGASLKRSCKSLTLVTILATIMMLSFFYLAKDPGEQTIPTPLISGTFISSALIWIVFLAWDFFGEKQNFQMFEATLKKVDVKKTFWLNLNKFSLLSLENDPNGECIYRYDLLKRNNS